MMPAIDQLASDWATMMKAIARMSSGRVVCVGDCDGAIVVGGLWQSEIDEATLSWMMAVAWFMCRCRRKLFGRIGI